MCNVCGCNHNGDQHGHTHEHHHHLHFGAPLTQAPPRLVKVEQDLFASNDRYAQANRHLLAAKGVLALNLVSSPGSGKTSLLVRTVGDLKQQHAIAVIEGDQQTLNDVQRIDATGVPALQINTGKGCHLDAHMIGHAFERLHLHDDSLLFIENVGNLVCPAGFDLGEAHKVVVLSVTEGEDKPVKYPDMFQAADIMLLNKIDLLPYVDFDVQRCIDYARRINPNIEVMQLSAHSGEGMAQWYQWIGDKHAALRTQQAELETLV